MDGEGRELLVKAEGGDVMLNGGSLRRAFFLSFFLSFLFLPLCHLASLRFSCQIDRWMAGKQGGGLLGGICNSSQSSFSIQAILFVREERYRAEEKKGIIK